MAPIEDLQARDLSWISDFVMQQMVIMLRPMMDHLSQTDSAVDYVQRQVQRMSMDVSEIRGDIERTNKYLSILRQGLGVQNEGKCLLQRTLDGNGRAVKRLDEQMETLLGVMRAVEDSFSQLHSDFRGATSRHEELSNRVNENNHALGDLQAKVERISSDAHSVKDDIMNSEAKLEAWHRELRELRRNQILVPKFEEKSIKAPPSSQSVRASGDSWPQKKSYATVEVPTSGANTPGAYAGTANFGEVSNQSGSREQSKRLSRVGSSSSRALLQQDMNFGAAGKSSSRVWSPGEASETAESSAGGNEEAENSRLPLLAARPRPDRAATDAPRLRFTATMANPPSRGSPQ